MWIATENKYQIILLISNNQHHIKSSLSRRTGESIDLLIRKSTHLVFYVLNFIIAQVFFIRQKGMCLRRE